MVRSLPAERVRDEFVKYGYTLPEDFTYKNNHTKLSAYDEQKGVHVELTLKQLRYRVKRGRSTYIRPEYLDMPVSDEELPDNDSFSRFLARHEDQFIDFDDDYVHAVFDNINDYSRKISRQQNFRLEFSPDDYTHEVHALNIVMKQLSQRLHGIDVRMTITDGGGNVNYAHFNPNTIKFLEDIYTNQDRDITDSNGPMIDALMDLKYIDFDFVPRSKGSRINPGFFPYQNVSDIDLTKYGIFSNIDDPNINESCLIQSFRAANVLTNEEMSVLRSVVKTRTVPRAELKLIAELFDIHINCKILMGDKTSHIDFNMMTPRREIKLIIVHGHYLLNEMTPVTEFYINNRDRINNDKRFAKHARKTLLLKFDDNRYSFSKAGLSVAKLITVMIDKGLLKPWTDAIQSMLEWSFKPSKTEDFVPPQSGSFDVRRPIKINDKKDSIFKREHKVPQTKHFFGYAPESPMEVEFRLAELQHVIDSLSVRVNINVRLYYKFSELMQKVMYEYGCFEGVYELSGAYADELRKGLVFPQTRTFNDKKFYSNEKLYYLDLNGAYMSCVDAIPSGVENGAMNPKIKGLIDELYAIRMTAKKNGNVKLATTIKFMMNSCWGYSIRRPKLMKHKYCKCVDKYIQEFAPYVARYNYSPDNISGWVDSVNSVVIHFTYPQFAKRVLDNYHKKFNDIKRLVNVYYENVDAILINESDYQKLLGLGYIGNDLGQFKVEKVFTEIAIISSKRYVATLENGEKYYHGIPQSGSGKALDRAANYADIVRSAM